MGHSELGEISGQVRRDALGRFPALLAQEVGLAEEFVAGGFLLGGQRLDLLVERFDFGELPAIVFLQGDQFAGRCEAMFLLQGV
jgi:hypothetical protein